jgi:hypothetical protein
MRKITLGVAALVVMAMAIPAGAGKADHFTADLNELNDSGVNGHAVLWQMGDTLRVNMTVNGLDPDLGHAQHIHGLAEGIAECPTMDLAGDDGFLSLAEGLPSYGPPVLFLRDGADFPAPNPGGVTTTRVTYATEGLAGALGELDTRVIVIHGLDIDGNAVYEGIEGPLPVACGVIVAQP